MSTKKQWKYFSIMDYEKEEEYLTGGRIQRYVNWNKVSYYELEEIKEQNKEKEIKFKNLLSLTSLLGYWRLFLCDLQF